MGRPRHDHDGMPDAYGQCSVYARLLRLHDPDPYYVGHLFSMYLRAADAAINDIFAGADTDFGLFARGRPMTRDSFAAHLIRRRQLRRQRQGGSGHDALATEFLRWYDGQYDGQWHHPPGSYPHLMRIARDAARTSPRLPDVRITMVATDMYRDDPVYEMDMAGLTVGGRLRSRAELDAQVRRRTPVFLEMVNHKRRRYGEPATRAGRVAASASAALCGGGARGPYATMNIPRAAEVYVSTIKRMRAESALRMREVASSPAPMGRSRIWGAALPP